MIGGIERNGDSLAASGGHGKRVCVTATNDVDCDSHSCVCVCVLACMYALIMHVLTVYT